MLLKDPTNNADKLLNYIGGTAGTLAPFLLGDGMLGAAEKAAPGVLKNIVNPANLIENALGKTAVKSALSGVVGTGVNLGTRNLYSNEQYTP
jgi:hypothetical protein